MDDALSDNSLLGKREKNLQKDKVSLRALARKIGFAGEEVAELERVYVKKGAIDDDGSDG